MKKDVLDQFNKSQKMVLMVVWMQRRGGIRIDELRSRFDLDSRSMRRYLADIKDLGLPVYTRGRGGGRVVYLEQRYRRTGVQLTLGELISLRFGRTLFDFLDGTQFAEDIEQAIDRLQPSISRATADVVEDFDRTFIAVPEPAKDYTGGKEVIDEVLSALLYSNRSDAEYRRLGGSTRAYVLEPYTMATYRRGLYLFARDVEEDRIKTFAVERFVSFTRRRNRKFRKPPQWDPREFVADSFGIIGGRPEAVVVRFSARVADYIRERKWHGSQGLMERPDGSVEILLRCAVTPELRQWILGFGPDAQVLEPPALREEIAQALAAAAEVYRTAPQETYGLPAADD